MRIAKRLTTTHPRKYSFKAAFTMFTAWVVGGRKIMSSQFAVEILKGENTITYDHFKIPRRRKKERDIYYHRCRTCQQ